MIMEFEKRMDADEIMQRFVLLLSQKDAEIKCLREELECLKSK